MWIRRETLQIANCISFQSERLLQLMHLFLYASSASENWIMKVFWCFVIAIWEQYIRASTYQEHCLLSLCHISLFTLTLTHTHSHFDAPLKPQSSSGIGVPGSPTCAAGAYYWVKQVQRASRIACWECWSQICVCICNKVSVQGRRRREPANVSHTLMIS